MTTDAPYFRHAHAQTESHADEWFLLSSAIDADPVPCLSSLLAGIAEIARACPVLGASMLDFLAGILSQWPRKVAEDYTDIAKELFYLTCFDAEGAERGGTEFMLDPQVRRALLDYIHTLSQTTVWYATSDKIH